MKCVVLSNADAVATEAARLIALQAHSTVQQRGRFVLAVSGGRTPWQMLRALAKEDVPWPHIHIVQVDERVAPPGHPDRNLVHIQNCLLPYSPMRPEQIHPMPVESTDLESAASDYAEELKKLAGSPPVLDLVHLGLGADGHTASLVPADPILDVTHKDVATTEIYQQRRRMSLTFPLLNRSRQILWVVTGREKRAMLARLQEADSSIPAGRIRQDVALILADRDAAGSAESDSGQEPLETNP